MEGRSVLVSEQGGKEVVEGEGEDPTDPVELVVVEEGEEQEEQELSPP